VATRLFFARGAVGLCGLCAVSRTGIPTTEPEFFRPDAPCELCGLETQHGVAFRDHVICEPCLDGAWWVAAATEEEDACTFCGVPGEENESRIKTESIVCCLVCLDRMSAIVHALVRNDLPQLLRTVRCTACGTSTARTFVWSEHGLVTCDRCILWWQDPDGTPPPVPVVHIDAVEQELEGILDAVKRNEREPMSGFATMLGILAANRCVASKRWIARIEFLMASPLRKAGRHDDARAAYERAIALYEEYADGVDIVATRNLAAACINLATQLRPEKETALALLTRAIDLLEPLRAEHDVGNDIGIAQKERLRLNGPDACSFCGKLPRDVRKMMVGDHARVCDECVGLCNDILFEDPIDPSAPHKKGPTVCSFCGADDGHRYIAGPSCFICDACITRSNDIIAEESPSSGDPGR
jgi:hypothetical protein